LTGLVGNWHDGGRGDHLVSAPLALNRSTLNILTKIKLQVNLLHELHVGTGRGRRPRGPGSKPRRVEYSFQEYSSQVAEDWKNDLECITIHHFYTPFGFKICCQGTFNIFV
jgi:hypothetical protein